MLYYIILYMCVYIYIYIYIHTHVNKRRTRVLAEFVGSASFQIGEIFRAPAESGPETRIINRGPHGETPPPEIILNKLNNIKLQ